MKAITLTDALTGEQLNIQFDLEEDNQISVDDLSYYAAKKIMKWLDENTEVKRKLLQVTEISEFIKELPKIK